MLKRFLSLFFVAGLGLTLAIFSLLIAKTQASQAFQTPEEPAPPPASEPRMPAPISTSPHVQFSPSAPAWEGSWVLSATMPFSYTYFDAEYYPGDGLVYFLGGRLANGTIDGSVWVFNPYVGVYTDTGVNMPTPIASYQISLLEDANGWGLYTFCGRQGISGIVDIVQVYYPDTNTAMQLNGADNFPGTGTCTAGMQAVYSNRLYSAGGFDTVNNFTQTWVFDPLAPTGSRWTQLTSANFTTPRAFVMSAVVDDLIYAIGGNYLDGTDFINVQTVEVLDPNEPFPVWNDAAVPDLPEGCSEAQAWGFDSSTPYADPDGTPLEGKIITACGSWSDENNHVWVYDPAFAAWQAFPSLNLDRRGEAATLIPLGVAGSVVPGVPGIWVWGGRKDDDSNILNSSEYYALRIGAACQILLVDDDLDFGSPNFGGRYYYTSTLDALNRDYDLWDSASMGALTFDMMTPYDVIVWFTGYESVRPISITEEVELIDFLDNGGNVFVSAQDQYYAYGMTPLLRDYFWIRVITDDVVITNTIGNIADPVFHGLGPFILERPDAWDAYWPTGALQGPYNDEVYARPGGYEPFLYTTSGTPNSTRYKGSTFKSMFLGWPFEWLANLEDRTALMEPALTWLCYPNVNPFELHPPEQQGSSPQGTTVTYTLTLQNDLGYADTFSLTYDAPWATAGPAIIGPLADHAFTEFTVSVEIPPGENCFSSILTSVTAIPHNRPDLFDLAMLETSVSAEGLGNVEGTVLDINTNLGIPNAYISMQLAGEFHETYANNSGAYTFENVLAECTFTLTPEAQHYLPAQAYTTTVQLNTTVTKTMSMVAPMLTWSQDSFQADLISGERITHTLWITNAGTSALAFTLDATSGSLLFANLPAPASQGETVPSQHLPLPLASQALPWIILTPSSGVLQVGNSMAIQIVFLAPEVSANTTYSGLLQFTANEPYHPALALDLTLHVQPSTYKIFMPLSVRNQ